MLRKHFPQTGEQRNKLLVIFGLVIFMGIVIVVFYRRKNN
ncbi:LPXTG cell wall anchor domain-containing protein [Enterococcus faecalis]